MFQGYCVSVSQELFVVFANMGHRTLEMTNPSKYFKIREYGYLMLLKS